MCWAPFCRYEERFRDSTLVRDLRRVPVWLICPEEAFDRLLFAGVFDGQFVQTFQLRDHARNLCEGGGAENEALIAFHADDLAALAARSNGFGRLCTTEHATGERQDKGGYRAVKHKITLV